MSVKESRNRFLFLFLKFLKKIYYNNIQKHLNRNERS